MSDQNSEELEKIEEYFRVIQSRIVEPIQKPDVGRYCTATLLLLFAAIDGLGKLIHPNPKAGSNDRIRCFLNYMGESYEKRKKELLKLRHSLVHNAINVASFMSQTEIGSDQHLKRIGSGGFIYVNTSILYNDFCHAFERLRDEFVYNEQMLKRAAGRLDWIEEDVEDLYPEIPASPPPPVEFIWAK
ncbi:MAG: hypothetical protein P8X90_13260 [Desulfobacterales bacterium]